MFLKKRKNSRGEWFLVLLPGPKSLRIFCPTSSACWPSSLSLSPRGMMATALSFAIHLHGHLSFDQEIKNSFPEASLTLAQKFFTYTSKTKKKRVMHSLLLAGELPTPAPIVGNAKEEDIWEGGFCNQSIVSAVKAATFASQV